VSSVSAPEVVVVDTKTANLASVLAGLRRAGAAARVSADAAEVGEAPLLVLPGVGAFAAGMERLVDLGLVDALAARVRAGRPLLAVCLGLQLLCAASDESPGLAGIGVIEAVVRRFPREVDGARLLVPQLGWNRVLPEPGCRLLEPGYAYYANSYRLGEVPSGYFGAESDHGGPFVAALERDASLFCQFHPELSGAWGLGLLRRWLAAAEGWLAREGAAARGVAC
jgi:imidazole glycerol phosphate synthase glutamine amidotransferase subunit